MIERLEFETVPAQWDGSNGKNCTTCNKSSVCKYKDSIEREVKRIIEELEEKELPLSVNINCREWSSNNLSLTR